MRDVFTGINWTADAGKACVVCAARGRMALCMLLCKKRKVRRLSEHGKDQDVRILFSDQTINSTNWS